MAYENKTVQEIYRIFYDGLTAKFNQTFRLLPKSFIHVLCKVVAGVFVTGYKSNAWWGLQQFPSTAYYGDVSCLGVTINPLKQLGNLYGAGEPYSATQWQGIVQVGVVSSGGYLKSGTQLKSAVTGKIYLTAETVLLDGESVSVVVKCADGGKEGNLASGDVLRFVNPLSSVQAEASVSTVTQNGTDEESESAYRARIEMQFKTKPHGGAYADFREWASDVANVLQVYPYGDCAGISGDDYSATGVIMYVSGNKDVYVDRVPDGALLKAVGEACTYDPETGKMRRMIGQVIDPLGNETYSNVRAVSVKKFDVYITGFSGSEIQGFADMCKSSLATYFEGREPYIKGLSSEDLHKITLNNVLGVINEIAISAASDFESASMVSNAESVTSYELGYGELAALNALYINGVAV